MKRPSKFWLIVLGFAFLVSATVSQAIILEGWTLSSATRLSDGTLRLFDVSAVTASQAVRPLKDPVESGEIRWKARHVEGRGSRVYTLRLDGPIGGKWWEVAVFNAAVYLRNAGEQGAAAFVPQNEDWFAMNKWADFRLVFDTKIGRAQLYVNDLSTPVAEIKNVSGPVSRVTLIAGHELAVGQTAEFSTISLDRISAVFKTVRSLPWQQDASTNLWPELRSAPAEWTVQDKFAQFSAWWPGKPGENNARDALRQAVNREAIGLGNEFTAALRLVPQLANSIRWEPPYQGAQQSHLYRSSPAVWDQPSNARLMECTSLLARIYALNQPWNPYFRDPALGRRLSEALEYWLSLQNPEGGFSEYRGFGSNELPAVSFGLIEMGDIYDAMKGEQLFLKFKSRWIDSMKRAVLWASIEDSPQRKQGILYSNQFIGILFGAWNLYEATGDESWLSLYVGLSNWWLQNGQTGEGWYIEGSGREDFSYANVTNLYLNRLAIKTADSRLLDSLRKACLASQMIVVYEMDRETTVYDVTGHPRTSPLPSLNFQFPKAGDVSNPSQKGTPIERYMGWFNHMAADLPEAQAFALHAQTQAEATARRQLFFDNWPASLSWRNNPAPIRATQQGAFGWDNTGSYWPLPTDSQASAAVRTRPWAQSRFSEAYSTNKNELTCIRRPGYYATFRTSEGKYDNQSLGLGLLWMPGFGAVFVSSNRTPAEDPQRPVFGWTALSRDYALKVSNMRMAWEGSSLNTATRLNFTSSDQPKLQFGLGEEILTLYGSGATFYLPLVSRDKEILTLSDGSIWTGVGKAITTSLRLRRIGINVTHDVIIDFKGPVEIEVSSPVKIGADLIVRSLKASTGKTGDWTMAFQRVKR